MKVNLNSHPTQPAPSTELIQAHNNFAQRQRVHYCRQCWTFVGQVNIHDHQQGSCESLDTTER